MRSRPVCDVSVIVPVFEAEDHVGHHLRGIAAHLRALDRSFEILALDEGSGDNSLAVLALLLEEIPELTVIPDCDPGRGYSRGARVARGRALVLAESLPALRGGAIWAPLSWALSRLEEGLDVVVIDRRYAACRRTRGWRACDAVRGRGPAFLEALARRARSMRLLVEVRGGPRQEGMRTMPAPQDGALQGGDPAASVKAGFLGGLGLPFRRRRAVPAALPSSSVPVAPSLDGQPPAVVAASAVSAVSAVSASHSANVVAHKA